MDLDEQEEPAVGNDSSVRDFALDEKTTGGFNAWFHSLPHVSASSCMTAYHSLRATLTGMLLTGA